MISFQTSGAAEPAAVHGDAPGERGEHAGARAARAGAAGAGAHAARQQDQGG